MTSKSEAQHRHVVITGAGLGGMTAAIELAGAGYRVTVLEKNQTPGGKIQQIQEAGFRFDTGPSLVTMPFLLEELFERANLSTSLLPELVAPEPGCRYFWKDGTRFDTSGDLSATLSQIRQFAPEDETGYVQMLGHSAGLYEKTAETFLFNPLSKLSDFSSLKLSDAFRINAGKTVSQVVDRYVRSPYLRQFFKRFTTYNGSSPYLAPATLNVIPFVELARGGWYVKGGIHQITEAMIRAMEELGVTLQTGCEVSEIEVTRSRAIGVRTADGKHITADAVVANSDATETYTKLLTSGSVPKRVVKKVSKTEPSCSGFVLLLGTDCKWEQLSHHNIFFSEDYKKEFEDIFTRRQLPRDPTIYIADTSATEPEHAIAGGSNLFVLINAPYIHENEPPQESTAYADNVINMLEQRGITNLSRHIRYRKIITPGTFYEWFRSNRGSIYGTSSNSKFAAFMRPRNKSPYVEGLYLCGGSTHPGGGIPLVLLSARHAARAVISDLSPGN